MEKRGPVGQDIFMAEKLLPIPPTSPSSSLLGTGTAQVSPRDELARTLSPVIAVAASLDADELCQKNHIPSFADYIKPFGDHIQGRGNSICY
ncbi:hypothetical protein BDF14DRAFT_429304 [Spinellus fusiger]|nr:hypothetical protein BDF14DRAFT_429304 [Spinellus fusiger]